ncbi:MAG: DNA polymerase III subunit beta [Rickettsiales bacterium]
MNKVSNFKIQIAQKEFLKIVLIATSITDGKSLNSSIGVITIKANKDYIKIISSNNIILLEQKILINTNTIVLQEGEITVEASILLSIIKIFNNKLITIYAINDIVHIESDTKFKINQIANNLYKKVINILPDTFSIVLDANNFANMLKYTKFAIAAHESRSNLNCIALKYENNEIISYGMDGHRFARFAIKYNKINSNNVNLDNNLISTIKQSTDEYFANYIQNDDNSNASNNLTKNNFKLLDKSLIDENLENNNLITIKEVDFKILIPTKLIEQILTIISTFKIEHIYISINQFDITLIFINQDNINENSFQPNINIYKNNHINLTSKLINAEFIDYDKIIPNFKEYKYLYQINAAILAESIYKVTAISNEKFKALKCDFFDNIIQITSYGQNDAKAVDIISIINLNINLENNNNLSQKNNYIYNKENIDNIYIDNNQIKPLISIGFNYRYLLDVLDVLKDHNIKIYIQNNMSPIVIISEKLENSTFIIMPIKI